MSRIDGGTPPRTDVISDPVRPTTPIEPVGEPAAITPYEPGAGRWVAAGFSGLMGGLLGLGVGAAFTEGRSLGVWGNVLAGGVALAGAAGAAFGGWHLAQSMGRSSHEKNEHARVQAEFGTSTLQNAREYMARFDHDQDGQVDLVNRTGLPGQDENVFTEKRDQSDSHLKYDWWDDDWDVDTDHWTESRGVSALDIWKAANVAPEDDKVTDVELATLMSKYDADRNGALNQAEKDAFTAANPVIMDEWRK
jgi:hypothetical protein